MKFEDMNAMQRRLHNAACVLDGDGDEHGFVGLLREAIDELWRLRGIVKSNQNCGCSITACSHYLEFMARDKDAERYRWLRDENCALGGIGWLETADEPDEFDAAIDEALKTPNAEVRGD